MRANYTKVEEPVNKEEEELWMIHAKAKKNSKERLYAVIYQ